MPSNLGAGSGMLILEFLKAASGKFAKLFCADDLMRPDCLEKLVGYMLKHPETDVAFGDMEYVDAKGDSLETRWSLRRPHFEFGKPPEDSLHLLFDSISFLPYPCSIAKTDVLRKAEIDASSDATPEVVETAKKSLGGNLKYVRHSENIGADANFHAALDGASRKYTMFMHDDDIAHPNYLEYAIEAINIFGNVALLASDYTCVKLHPIHRYNLITPKRRHSYSTTKKNLPHTYSATVELHTPQPYTARRICGSLTAPISTEKSETLPS